MCDYSLHLVASRPARVEDKLVTTKFNNSMTRGLAAIGERHVAICLLPGTEIAFDENVECEPLFGVGVLPKKKIGQRLARFRLRIREVPGGVSGRGYDEIALRRQKVIATWQPHRLEEGGLKLPPILKPEGPGYMPLYFAAQWIATRGGTVEIDPSDLSVWQDTFAQLLARIASEQVSITGIRDGERKKLDDAEHGFTMIFSNTPFPSHQYRRLAARRRRRQLVLLSTAKNERLALPCLASVLP